jgi:hypothetical protein
VTHSENAWVSAPNPAGAAPLRPALKSKSQNRSEKEKPKPIIPPVGRGLAITDSERKNLLKWAVIG